MSFISRSQTTLKNVVEVTSNGTYTAGQLVKFNLTTGALESTTTTTTQTEAVFVVLNSVTSGAVVSLQPTDKSTVYVVDTANNSNAAHNGQRMIITAGGLTLTNTGTDVSGATGMFAQIGVVGAAADKKILAVRA
jgi:hypothetical protein